MVDVKVHRHCEDSRSFNRRTSLGDMGTYSRQLGATVGESSVANNLPHLYAHRKHLETTLDAGSTPAISTNDTQGEYLCISSGHRNPETQT